MLLRCKYFGTDGIRGKVGEEYLNPHFVMRLASALGTLLIKKKLPLKVCIGKDTRVSGALFESVLQAGLIACGIDVYLLGTIPTPAVAFLTKSLHAGAGIVISASHNPYYDNGIKFFSNTGSKLSSTLELEIEAELKKVLPTINSNQLGTSLPFLDATGRYIEFCKQTFPKNKNLENIKIVLDCANGAASYVAPAIFTELGATVIVCNNKPDGFNINNECGAVYPHKLSSKVVEEKADVGIALDGDGDRVIMLDHRGCVTDGDELLYILAKGYLANDTLSGGVVGTVMSNHGLELALQALGVAFLRTPVGDRHILQALEERQWNLGGENSGHLICLDAHTSGDGIISALKILQIMLAHGLTLAELKNGMHKFPQVLINVPLSSPVKLLSHPEIIKTCTDAEARLQDKGRVLLRSSGTESLLRVMVEGEDEILIKSIAQDIVDKLHSLENSYCAELKSN